MKLRQRKHRRFTRWHLPRWCYAFPPRYSPGVVAKFHATLPDVPAGGATASTAASAALAAFSLDLEACLLAVRGLTHD